MKSPSPSSQITMELPSSSTHDHAEPLTQAPVLSTPETHLFEDPTPPSNPIDRKVNTDEEIWEVYEIERTAREIVQGKWRRVALQFPDTMLSDATRVFERLEVEVGRLEGDGGRRVVVERAGQGVEGREDGLETDFTKLEVTANTEEEKKHQGRVRFYILADTSYNACCVDEIAAEHADAEVVVHYGRSCLSPTARLPVIYVFTSHPLDLDAVVQGFEDTFRAGSSDEEGRVEVKTQKVVLMADITYNNHVEPLAKLLRSRGWTNIIVPEIIHDPEAVIPNRKIPGGIGEEELKEYKLFHISDPPNALVMILYARVDEFIVYATDSTSPALSKPRILDNTRQLLNRRYALLSHLIATPIVGILVNTLSHSSTSTILKSLTCLLQKHGKKYYTFVVGKVNAAKMANFAEIGGWVVVGCWEGGLFDEGGFWRGTVTPFELDLALRGEGWRVRGGEWRSGPVMSSSKEEEEVPVEGAADSKPDVKGGDAQIEIKEDDDEDSLSESEPPEYDFRTGRYITSSVSKAVPKKAPATTSTASPSSTSKDLVKKNKNTDLATVNGVLSAGAEYLRSQRTWQGLGTDFTADFESGGDAAGTIEEGRRGVARGYVVGDEDVERR